MRTKCYKNVLNLSELETPSVIKHNGGNGQIEMGVWWPWSSTFYPAWNGSTGRLWRPILSAAEQRQNSLKVQKWSLKTVIPHLRRGYVAHPLPKMPVLTLGKCVGWSWHWVLRFLDPLLGWGFVSLPPWAAVNVSVVFAACSPPTAASL